MRAFGERGFGVAHVRTVVYIPGRHSRFFPLGGENGGSPE